MVRLGFTSADGAVEPLDVAGLDPQTLLGILEATFSTPAARIRLVHNGRVLSRVEDVQGLAEGEMVLVLDAASSSSSSSSSSAAPRNMRRRLGSSARPAAPSIPPEMYGRWVVPFPSRVQERGAARSTPARDGNRGPVRVR
jgi:hypothetical protein